MARIIGRLDDLAATVQRNARGDALDKEAEARRQAEDIAAEARERAERLREEILADARTQAEEIRRQRIAEATLQAKRKRLAAREELLDQVWQHAEERLRDVVESDAYPEVLRRLAWLAVTTLGPRRFTLAADARGHELLTKDRLETWSQEASEEFDATVTFERAAEPADTWGGLMVIETEGRRRIDATFPTRLAAARDEIREAVFQRLVPES